MPHTTAEHRAWAFGEFTLDLDRGALLRDGTEVRLRPKSYAVLTLLVERHGRLVTKEELLNAVWGHTAVTEGALTQVLIDIRRALGDGSQKVIRTVPRRGYLFDVPAEMVGPAAAATAGPARPPAEIPAPVDAAAANRRSVWGLGLAVGVVLALIGLWWGATERGTEDTGPAEAPTAGPHAPSIAVLPFLDLSPEGDQGYFSDGLAEELLNLLAQVPGLKVIARTSSFSFKDQNVDVTTIARRLNVDHVLEGSVRKWGNRVRVTAQLVETEGSSHLWSATYERDLEDVFAIQDEIAAGVANALQVTLADELKTDGGTRDARALEHYLQGRYFYSRRGPGDLERAAQSFRRALEFDPAYGRAWAGLAGALFVALYTREMDWDEGQAPWAEAVERALTLAPELPDALLRAAAYEYHVRGDAERARELRARAVAIAPEDPLMLAVAAGDAHNAGRTEEAIELARRTASLDPVAAVYQNNLGSYLVHAGRYDQAQASFDRALALNPAYADRHEEDRAFLLALQGRHREALGVIEAWPAGELRDFGLALVYGPLGRSADADAALERLKALETRGAAARVAEVYAQTGSPDAAFEWLDVALARAAADPHPLAAGNQGDAIWNSWFLKPLHDDPRWGARRLQ